MQCRNSSRDGSKYCASHKGYQPKTAAGVATLVGEPWEPKGKKAVQSKTDTLPRHAGAADTLASVRKTASKAKK